MVEAVWGEGVTLRGYLAVPASGRPRAALVLCPDRDGATPFFEGVARAFAKAGYTTLLADPLARAGGTAAVPEHTRAALLTEPGAAALRVADLRDAAAFVLEKASLGPQRLGVVGFGFGGADAWAAAVSPLALEPRPRAVVLFGAPPPLMAPPAAPVDSVDGASTVPPVLAHYGEHGRHAADLPALERRLRDLSAVHAVRVHPGAGRAFWHEPDAAEAVGAAWRETLDWLATHLVRPTGGRRPRPRAGPRVGPGSGAKPN